jgi:glycosyltransferase involved in cell wall biosynthesis
MRIVLVDPRGDSRPYDHGLAAGLAARGHEVRLVTSRFRHADLPPAAGVTVDERFYRLADRLPGRLRRVARGLEHPFDMLLLLGRLALRRPDVVHVEWLPLPVVDRLLWRVAARLLRLRLVHTAHNAVPKEGVSAAGGLRADCAPFAAVIVHSEAGRASLVRIGVLAARVRRVRHGALDGYAHVASVAPAGVPGDAPVAAFLGLIRPYKGLDLLLDAWPAVRAAVPGACLYVAGRPFGDASGARAAAMAREGVVAALRYTTAAEFAGALRRADCVVLPYRSIDLSGVLFAALALARPLVATDVGGLREAVEETGAGLVVPPDDPAALAEAVTHVLADARLRERLAAAAAAAAAGPYSWAAVAEATEAVYAASGG